MRILRSIAAPALWVTLACGSAGCAALGYPVGSVYTGTHVPHGMMLLEGSGSPKGGMATGEACATGILGIAAFGDASLAAAKGAGGITDVHSVEFRSLSILGIYTQGCTSAHGPAGGGPPPPAVAADAGDGNGAGGGHGGGGKPKHGGDKGGGEDQPTGGHVEGSPLHGHGTPGTTGANGGMNLLPPGGQGGPPVIAPDPTRKVNLVPFNFLFSNRDHHDECLAYDPTKGVQPGRMPFPVDKSSSEYTPNQGRFVDRCPTENLVATCDGQKNRQQVTFYYRGKTDAELLGVPKMLCVNDTWTWIVPPAAVAKLAPDTATLALACDIQNGNHSCLELRPDANPVILDMWKKTCGTKPDAGVVVPRCPAQGVTARCDGGGMAGKGTATVYYETDAPLLALQRGICERSPGASWSAP